MPEGSGGRGKLESQLARPRASTRGVSRRHTHTHAYTFITHSYTCIDMHGIYTYIHVHSRTHTYTYTYIHIHTHTYTYIHIHTHSYVFVHIHMPTHTRTCLDIITWTFMNKAEHLIGNRSHGGLCMLVHGCTWLHNRWQGEGLRIITSAIARWFHEAADGSRVDRPLRISACLSTC